MMALIKPAFPPAANPDVNSNSPLSAEVDAPECSLIKPLLPSLALPEESTNSPDVPEPEEPDDRSE